MTFFKNKCRSKPLFFSLISLVKHRFLIYNIKKLMFNNLRRQREYISIIDLKLSRHIASFLIVFLYKFFFILRPFLAALIIRNLTAGDATATYLTIIAFTASSLLYHLFFYLKTRIHAKNSQIIYRNLNNHIFDKLTTIDEDFSSAVSKGRLTNIINTDLISIAEYNDRNYEIFSNILQVFIIIGIVCYINLNYGLIMLAFFFIYFLFKNHADHRFNDYWAETLAKNDEYTNLLIQILNGLSEVKSFHMLPKLNERLSEIQAVYDDLFASERAYKIFHTNDSYILDYGFQAILYTIITIQIFSGDLTIDFLVLMIGYEGYLVDFCDRFLVGIDDLRWVSTAVRRTTAILNYTPSKRYVYGDLDKDHITGNLEIENLSLTLNRQPILKDINLKIRPHEIIALVGYPGAGKTKLFDLILRLEKPTHGKILLDGTNIQRFSRAAYSTNVSVATQDPFIFNTSIRKNLDFVDPDHEHQIAVCKTVGVHDFIDSLPSGYNTIIRENGTNISSGQRQLISVARTILTNSEILLFDDIVSPLDPATARKMPALMKRLAKNHTIILATRKPYFMECADRIVVLDNGKISAIGSHESLLKRNKIYQSLQAHTNLAKPKSPPRQKQQKQQKESKNA